MLSSLEALDEPLEPTSTVPKVGAFQPKAKPRAKKSNNNASSNVGGKSKANLVDKKIPKPCKEIKPIVKENPLSPPTETIVGSQVILSGPLADSSIDVKPDVGPSAIRDPIEEKPVMDTVEEQANFSPVSAFPEVSQLSEDVELTSFSNPVEESHVSVPFVHESVLEETIANSASLETIEEILHPSPFVEEATVLIDSELEPPSVLPQTTASIAAHDNDAPESIHDTLDASFPSPEFNSVGEHTVADDGYEKLQAELRNSKRKPEAMPHCIIADAGESAEDAYGTKVSPSSKKHCIRDQQLQNGASKPIINEKDKNGFQNLEGLENGTDYVMNLDDRSNNQSKCKREKIPVRKPSNGHMAVQHGFVDNGENCCVSNTNISPEGSVPISNSYETKIDQHRSWRQKLKEQNASDSSTKMQNEVLEDRESPSFQNLNSFPDTEVILENSSEGRIINHSKHLGLKTKARKVADASARMEQEVQVENSPNEFTSGNNTDGQFKSKLKQKKQKTKGKKATNESMEAQNCSGPNSEAHVSSNVETGENCFHENVDTSLEAHLPSDDPPVKSRQTRHQKRKPTPLSKDFDNERHSEDQEPEENARGKQRRNKRKDSVNGKSLESSKKKFSHSTVRHKRRVEKHLLEMPEADLDPKKLKIKDLIRLAEAKEKIRNKEEAAKKSHSLEAASNSNANVPSKEPDEDERASFAPQFKIVNGEIVLDEESLVVTHRELNTDDLRTYRRVEESTSKLNYHTYMNRTPVERWTKSETELFYKAMQQFGTDFAMIQHLFPGRTRRQVKSKFKMEERKNPLQLADVLTNRPQDHSQFEKLIEKLKIPPVAAENSNSNGKTSTLIDLEDITFEKWNGAREEAETINQINSTLEVPETQESEKMQGRENDSMLPEEISEIAKSNATSATPEDLNKHKEDSPSPENVSNEPIAKPKSLFSYQVGTSKPKSLFGYQL